MTSQPPFIGLQTLPTTPSHEWARDTTNALGTNANDQSELFDQKPAATWRSSTPDPDIPGSFTDSSLNGEIDTQEIVDVVKSYIPAQGDVQSALSRTGEVAKQFLPEAVTSYFALDQDGGASNSTQLPITTLASERADTFYLTPNTNNSSFTSNDNLSTQAEAGSAIPTPTATPGARHGSTTEGVGDLPGSQAESDIAILPGKRNDNEISDTENMRSRGVSLPSGTRQGFVLPEDRNQIARDDEAFRPPHIRYEGVGSLPGTPSEAVIAILPEERNMGSQDVNFSPQGNRKELSLPRNEPLLNVDARTYPLGGDGAHWGGVPLNEDHQRMLNANPDPGLNNGVADTNSLGLQDGATNETKMEMMEGKVQAVGRGREVPAHGDTILSTTSAPSSESESAMSTTAVTGDSNKDLPTSFAQHRRLTRAEGTDSVDSGGLRVSRKVSFMDKVKGEAKILKGKLGNNEEKVEAGKKLMGRA